MWEKFVDNDDLMMSHSDDGRDEYALGSGSSKRPRYALKVMLAEKVLPIALFRGRRK